MPEMRELKVKEVDFTPDELCDIASDYLRSKGAEIPTKEESVGRGWRIVQKDNGQFLVMSIQYEEKLKVVVPIGGEA